MAVMAIVLGLAVLFNFWIVRKKWAKGQYLDVVVDIAMLVVLNMVFGGAILGAVSATMGSTFISLYLMRAPLTIPTATVHPEEVKTSPEIPQAPARSWAEKFDSLFD